MANKQYTVEDIAKIRKGMTEARQKRSEEIAKQTNAAPKYNSLPTLDDTSKRVPTQAPSSMNVGNKTFKVADNARNTTLNKNNGNAVRPSTKYSNQTAGLSKPQPKRDAKFDKDFDDFYEWRYNRADTTDYDANTDTNVPHWESVKRDIMKKNNWSEADFDKKWKEYDKMRTQKMADEEVKKAADLSKSHPLLGAAVQQAYLPQTAIEGAETYLDNTLGLLRPDLKPSSSDDPRFTGTRVREASKQALRDNSKTKAGAVAKDIVGEFADLGMNAAISGGNPLLMGLLTGAQSATRNQMEALERGSDSTKAALYGGGAGAISGVMNAIGLDKALGASAKTVLGTIGKSAATEALENVVEDSANLGLDELINKDYSQLQTLHDYYVGKNLSDTEAWAQVAKDTGIDLLKSAGSGALFGGFMSGVKNGAPVALEKGAGKILDWITKRDSKKANDLADRLLALDDTSKVTNENVNNAVPGMDDVQRITSENVNGARIDNVLPEQYNNVTGGVENGKDTADRTGNQEYFRPEELNSTGAKIGGNLDEKRSYTTKDGRTLSLRNVVNDNISRLMDDARINNFNLRETTGDNSAFSQQLQKAKEANANGRMVDSKSPEELENAKLFSDDKGTCGVAVEPDGNIVGVHKNPANKERGAVDDMLITARENGGDRLDCYGVYLVNKYEPDGFIPVARVEWNEKFKPDDWGDNPPEDIYMMMKDNRSTEQVLQDRMNGNGHLSDLNELESLPYFTLAEYGDRAYEEAKNYRNKLLEQPTSEVAFSMPENTPSYMGENAGLERVNDDGSMTYESEPIQTEGFNREGEARFMTNEAITAGIFTKDYYEKNKTLQDIAKIAKTSESESMAHAMETVDTPEKTEEWFNKVTKGEYQLGSDANKANSDFDTGMIVLQGLADELDMATTNAEKRAIVIRRNALLRKMKDFSHNMAIGLQAHAKWTNTADGAIMAGERLLGEQEAYWKGRNKSKVETNTKLAEALKRMGYDGSMDEGPKEKPTLDELREQVRNTLANEHSSVEEQFSDSDIDYLAGLLDQNATASEIADALNTKMATGTFGVSAETQAEVNRLFKAMDMVNSESEDYAKLQAEAFRLIANETKSHASPLEKFDAWRYLAMLGNPKTMVRNWVGNQLFNVVTGISNNIAALGEELADRRHFKKTGEHIERTKAFINPFSKEGRAEYNRAKRDFNLTRYVSGAGTKYKDTKSAIEDASSVFDSKLVQLYEQLTDAGISDTSAVRRKYATSLMGYMKANGLTEADMDASYKYDELNRQSRRRLLSKTEQAELEQAREKHQMMEKARDYALKEAEYATFHEDNAFAEALTKAANSSDIAKIFIDGMVPFKKTPANVLKSGLEYSPLGITKSGYLTIKHAIESKGDYADTYARKKLIGKGEKEVTKTTVNDVIDSWSKSLTGTGLALLGYMLYGKGVLQSSNKDEKYQDQLEGLQNFSIKLNIGGKDHTYTIDWAAPAVMPLLMGAEVKKVMEDRAVAGEKITPDDVIEIINSTINPIMETSMLQGVQNTLETVARQAGNSNGAAEFAGGVLGSLATNLATGYVTQAIPTVSGQLARTLDGTRRSTDTKSTSAFGSEAEKQMRKTMNKIPFLSRLNTPYLDAYGREQSNSPFEYSDRFTDEPVKNIAKGVGNLVYQSTSPGYLQKVNQTDSDKIRREAYNSLDESGKPIKEADVYAPWKSTVKMNGKKFTPEQMYTYRTKSGSASEEIGNALAKEDWYNDLSGKAQTELLKSTRSLVDNIGKAAVNKGFAPESSKAFEAYESGGIPSLMEYYKEEAHKDAVKAELGSTSEFATELYDSGDRSRMNKYRAAVDIASQYGKDTITEEQFLKYEKYGKQALEKDLEYANVAKELDVSNNKTFKSLVDKEVPEEQIKKAYDAITSVQIGEDEFGRPKYMSFNEDNYNIYRNYGEKGLEDYQYIESRGADFDTYLQAKKVLSLDKKEYVAKFNAIDGKTDSKVNGSISQKELLKLFNDKGFSESQANKYWQAFGKVSGDDAWKSVPVLKYNKKTGRTEWTTQKKK